MNFYFPVTACEVADALNIEDCEELTGEYIAEGMLNGTVGFTMGEIRKIAAYKGVSVDFLIHYDPSFRNYRIRKL